MTEHIRKTRIFNLIILGIGVLFSLTMAFAGVDEESYKSSNNLVHLTMIGGYAHSESIGGMADLNFEIQFRLSSHVRAGFGVGYLSGSDKKHMDGNSGGMMGSMNLNIMGGFSGHNHSLKVVPITLSMYYVLPLGPELDIFMFGGAGYYLGSYRDQATQNEGSFGPHAGLGADFKLSDRIAIVAEGVYRFVSLNGFVSELHEGFREGMEGEEHMEGFWHFHHHDNQWHFHEEHENEQHMLIDVPPFDIGLNGISLRIGIKFMF